MIDQIICGDCLEVMPQIPDKSINLAILDLPYNQSYKLNYNHNKQVVPAEWDKIAEYKEFVASVFKQCERILKDNGSLYWFHNDFNTIVDVYTWLRDNSRFVFRQFIVWNKKYKGVGNEGYLQGYNEVGSLRGYNRFAEYLLYYTSQDKTGLSCIYSNDSCFKSIREYMRHERSLCDLTNKQINQLLGTATLAAHYFNSTQWELPTEDMYTKLQTTGHFQREYKELRAEYEGLRAEYEGLRYTFNNQKTHHSVWNYPIDKKIGHVTPKPVALVETIIEHSSNEGDTVLDPTAGSGTTAVACKRSNRHYICIEQEQEYVDIANKRLNEML